MSASAKGGTLEVDTKSKNIGKGDKAASTTPESAKKQVTVKVSDNNIKNTGKKKPRGTHADVDLSKEFAKCKERGDKRLDLSKQSSTGIRESLNSRQVPQDAQDIILSSWRESTKGQYATYIKQWKLFCVTWQINFLQADIPEFNFLDNFVQKRYRS